MADSESGQSKKRVAGRQISKENPELDDDGPEPEMGFKKASDDVLAARRIVKVKRSQPTTQSSAPNPFASLKLVPPSDPANIKLDLENDTQVKTGVDEKQEKAEEKTEEKAREAMPEPESKVECDGSKAKVENKETLEGEAVTEPKEAEKKEAGEANQTSSVTSFGQLSTSQNAFMGLAGTGFGSSSFSFGSISSADKPAFSSTTFNISSSNNGNTPTMQEKPVETGEENEKAVFSADAILYEYIDGNWKERGKGELKLNVSLSDDEKARLVMRSKGNYRLIMNASLYPDMTLTNMDKKGVTFACINSTGEGKAGLTTFAIKFKDSSIVQEFRGAVEAHKGKKSAMSKTPENSPKASDV